MKGNCCGDVGFAASTRGKIRTAASGKIENCDHILRRGTELFSKKFNRLNNS
jgi:hypothetical protein